MPIDIDSAETFVLANARLLDRHRLGVLLHEAPVAPVLAALRAYRNPDGGFGHALEPDIRGPESEPAAVLHALEVLASVGALDDQMVGDAVAWVASTADSDGGVPFVTPAAARYPRGPWMRSSDGGSHLTFALAGMLWEAGREEPWLRRATDWCWSRLDSDAEPGSYFVKFALEFLDRVPDEPRARAAIEALRPRIGPDGSLPVAGGTEDERLTSLTLSGQPGRRSRALFTDEQIESELDRLEHGQQDDGGWTFDWLAWSPGQSAEWRGTVTLRALATLGAHGRIELPISDPSPRPVGRRSTAHRD
jgi:hypothetical protein